MRDDAGREEAPCDLQEPEAHKIGTERNAQINDPARPFEFLRDLVGIKLIDVDSAEHADDASEQGAAEQREYDHRLARPGRELFDEHIDADVNTGAHPERRAEFCHPHKHVGGKLLRPGEIDRGKLLVNPIGSAFDSNETVSARPGGKGRRVARSVAVDDSHESHYRGGADERRYNYF